MQGPFEPMISHMRKCVDRRVYTCWVLVERAEDLAGVWVSHCLNFDVIAHGDSPAQAIANVYQCAVAAVIDDLNAGLDPAERSAPDEEWSRLWKIVNQGTPIKLSQVKSDEKLLLATQITLAVIGLGEAADSTADGLQAGNVSQPILEPAAYEMAAA